VCSRPGCIELAVRDGRCEAHGESPWVRSVRAQKVSGEFRANRNRVLRSTRSRCAFCGVATRIVDHRLPVSLGGGDSVDNLQPLCEEHHREKTAQESLLGKRAAQGMLVDGEVDAHVERWTPAVFRYRGGVS